MRACLLPSGVATATTFAGRPSSFVFSSSSAPPVDEESADAGADTDAVSVSASPVFFDPNPFVTINAIRPAAKPASNRESQRQRPMPRLTLATVFRSSVRSSEDRIRYHMSSGGVSFGRAKPSGAKRRSHVPRNCACALVSMSSGIMPSAVSEARRFFSSFDISGSDSKICAAYSGRGADSWLGRQQTY